VTVGRWVRDGRGGQKTEKRSRKGAESGTSSVVLGARLLASHRRHVRCFHFALNPHLQNTKQVTPVETARQSAFSDKNDATTARDGCTLVDTLGGGGAYTALGVRWYTIPSNFPVRAPRILRRPMRAARILLVLRRRATTRGCHDGPEGVSKHELNVSSRDAAGRRGWNSAGGRRRCSRTRRMRQPSESPLGTRGPREPTHAQRARRPLSTRTQHTRVRRRTSWPTGALSAARSCLTRPARASARMLNSDCVGKSARLTALLPVITACGLKWRRRRMGASARRGAGPPRVRWRMARSAASAGRRGT
jgi:hypothetical protein